MPPVFSLYTRLTRRGVGLLALSLAVYVAVEVASFVQTYPDEASRQRLAEFGDQPAVRMLQGIPHAVETVGGFVVWDGGWFMEAIIGVWALLVASRLLRGEEESGRGEMLGGGSASGVRLAATGVLTVLSGCLVAGMAVFVTIVLPSKDAWGSLLFAAGLAGLGAVLVGVTAVAAQLVLTRRRVIAVAAGFLGVAFVLRMVANSGDERLWVGWLTPFGWMDRLRAFGDNRAAVLLLYLAVTGVLVWGALALRARRDSGDALLHVDKDVRPRPLLLQSPVRFAWRLTWGVLLAWALGIAFYSFFIGTLVKAMGDVLADDPAYTAYLELMGISKGEIYGGMVAVMAVVIALVISLYAAFRMGAVRNEEASERAEHLLTRPLSRSRWLGGHLVLALVGVAALSLVNAVVMWLGVVVTDAPIGLADMVEASLNLLPVILLFGGVAVAMFGLAPRLTIAVPAAAVAVAYVLSFVGPALDLPGWVTGLSPFYHVALVPVAGYAVTQGLVMLGIASLATAVGWVAFTRRDLVGA
jgi:ABC-2 type transport system permease protein